MSERAITILGMSGVGKTTISAILGEHGWTHYSTDYRIGSHYLEDEIFETILKKIEKIPFIKELIDSGTLTFQGRIRIENLYLLSQFLGKIGNPEAGGMAYKEFRRRQNLYHEAEIKAVQDVGAFIKKTGQNFIHDSSGSLCELPDKVIADLAEITDFVYIEATQEDEATLLERAKAYPKPLFYPQNFFDMALQDYIDERKIDYIALIDPDDFVRWIFPRLFYSRIPKYKELATKYGKTISSEDVKDVRTEKDILDLID